MKTLFKRSQCNNASVICNGNIGPFSRYSDDVWCTAITIGIEQTS